MTNFWSRRVLLAVVLSASTVLAQKGKAPQAATSAVMPPIKVAVDASRAPEKILHSTLQIPVKPGPLTLFYPKWIPGEHGPTGPIVDLTGLQFFAKGDRKSTRLNS